MLKAIRSLRDCVRWSTSVFFFVWILPLGAFIKPTEEAQACNGRRAICLCSNLLAKALDKQVGKTLVTQSAGSVQKEGLSSSPDFILHNALELHTAARPGSPAADQTFYTILITRTIDPVPKPA